jgi:hypothetical protein
MRDYCLTILLVFIVVLLLQRLLFCNWKQIQSTQSPLCEPNAPNWIELETGEIVEVDQLPYRADNVKQIYLTTSRLHCLKKNPNNKVSITGIDCKGKQWNVKDVSISKKHILNQNNKCPWKVIEVFET